MSHDAAFAKLVESRAREREQDVRVTWRKVSALTGGGWSGLGPDGALVYVEPGGAPGHGQSHYFYGTLSTYAGSQIRTVKGTAPTLPLAKRAAEALFQTPTTTNKRSTMTIATIPTAEALAEDVGAQAFAPDKAPYARLVTERGTLAYVSRRKDGVLLDFATSAVEGAPKRFQSALEAKANGRTTMHVTAANEKGAKALLAWVAKQIG
jgi:hypothetical protein